MTTEIDAIFVGDSHGMIMQSAAKAQGITFKHPVTAASATFAGANLSEGADGKLTFETAALRLDPTRFSPEKVTHRLQKANSIEQKLRAAVESGLPVYSNVGMTARNFVLGVVSAAKANGEDASLISRKLMRLAASEYFESFASQYETMKAKFPKVTAVFGPTRFDETNHSLWMAYDDSAIRMLEERGVEVLDLRAKLGDDTLLLRPEFYGDPDDGVHGNDHWGVTVVTAINDHYIAARTDLVN